MNILKNNQINTNITNQSSSSSNIPLFIDLAAALVFGLGLYFFKKYFKVSTYIIEEKIQENEKPKKPLKDNYKPLIDKLESSINKWEPNISLQKINSIITQELDELNYDPFGILDQLHKNNINTEISTINILLDTCIKLKDFKNFNRLCELIIESENYLNSNIPPANIVTFNIILKGLNMDMCIMNFDERKKFLASAKIEFLLKEILRRNIQPNEITLNTIIDMLVESGDFTLAWKYYEDMERDFLIEPDIFTYSTLLKSIKNFQPDEENIEKVFEILKMVKLSKTNGLKPDEIFYNCILETCVKYNKMEAAEFVFNDMREFALVTPSYITYSIMIKGFGNSNNLEKCFILFHEMKQYSIEPNEVIYGCILNACIKANNIFKACEIYNEIKNYSNITMNIYIYTILIKGYTYTKNFEKAYEIYYHMLADKNTLPNIIFFNAILDCCVECFDIEMMKKIYDDLRQRSVSDENYPQPDLITYSTIIKGYSKIKDSSKVLDIYYYLCRREDIKLDEIIYCSVLDCLLKTERLNEALSIYNEMIKTKINKTNASYSILIKIFSKINDVEKAVQIYNDMISEKIQPSLITYTAIIQILIKSKRIKNAIDIFEEILLNKIIPDQVLLNVIINGCVLNGKLEEGCKFLLESFKKEIKVCDDVYYNILHNLLKNRIMDTISKKEIIYKICQEMTFRGIEIDGELYNNIIKMLNGKNNYYQDEYSENTYYEKTHYENNDSYKSNNFRKQKNFQNKHNENFKYELNEEQSIYDFFEKKIKNDKNFHGYDKRTNYNQNYYQNNNHNNNYQSDKFYNNRNMKKNNNNNRFYNKDYNKSYHDDKISNQLYNEYDSYC